MEAIELYKEETMKADELKASGRKQVFGYSDYHLQQLLAKVLIFPPPSVNILKSCSSNTEST